MLWMSLGNICEQGKERMQRLVLKWLQSLHRKASQGVGMVTLSRPGTSCWKHLRGAEAQAFCFPKKAGCQGQEGWPSAALRVAVPGRQVWQWTCSCRHHNDSSWPQASTQRPLPAAASTQTNPAYPQAIKGCTLFLAMQMLQPLKKVTALTTTLGHSLWVSCLGKGGIFQSSLRLNEEKAGILSLTNAPPISAITAAELSNLFLSPRKSACLDTKPLRDGEPHTTSTNTLFQCMPAPPVQRASFLIYICQA